jgi:hypothetical protein
LGTAVAALDGGSLVEEKVHWRLEVV